MSEQTALAENLGTGLGLAGIRLAVVKRAKALAALPVIAALAASAVVVLIPDRYTASVLIQMEPPHKSAAKPGAPETPERPASEADRQEIEKQIEILRSASIINRVSDELQLAKDPEFKIRSLGARVTALFKSLSPEAEAREAIADRLNATRVRSTLMVSVQFTSHSAEKSARIANAIAAQYLAQKHLAAAADGATKHSSEEPTASERVFASLLDKYGLSRTLSGARIVAAAEPPRRPAGPKRIRIVATAAVSALVLALVLAMLLEREVSLRTRKVEKMLACPHMTSVPAMAANDGTRTPARGARMIVAEPQCPYAEAVRNACRELGHPADGGASRVILVASALPGEGSELFASNIAHHFAVDGHKSLLVDCDFRMKSLTRQLTPHTAGGLLDQIAGKEPVENVILRDSLTGVHFLPASGPAPIPLAASAALRSVEFSEAIASLKTRFSTIVLSAPPLLPVTDGRVLAELADQVVFLTAWHRTPRAIAKKALSSLEGNQRKVVGAVLTDIADDRDASVMSFAAIFDEIRRAARIPTIEHAA
jgi:Mrp family chromosome partitioning ATPase